MVYMNVEYAFQLYDANLLRNFLSEITVTYNTKKLMLKIV